MFFDQRKFYIVYHISYITMEKICNNCGNTFINRHPKALYCSLCKDTANRQKALDRYYKRRNLVLPEVKCVICNKLFIQDKFNINKKPLCSKICKQINQKNNMKQYLKVYKRKYIPIQDIKIEKQCLYCNKTFYADKYHRNMKYCSKQCSRLVNDLKYKLAKRKHKNFDNIVKKCKYCGEEFKLDSTKPINTELIRQYCCEAHRTNGYVSMRMKTDVNYKLLNTLRKQVLRAIINKTEKTIELTGADIETVRKHIESLFKSDMSWKNYGTKWEIDHIKPCKLFDLSDIKQQKECFNYKNLQPLYVAENRRKGATMTELNITEKQKQYITQRDNNACVFCHKKHTNIEPLTEVLLVPIKNGGKIDINNIFTCCVICKKIKSNKSFDIFINRTNYAKKHNITRTTVNPIIFQTKGVTH
jgi:hypothetical protein